MKRGALVGCGFFAQTHLHAWGMLEGAEIVAVCDIDKEKAERYAERFGVATAYADAAAMLEHETLDFVDIATQAHTHLDLTRLVAGHGLNLICQKPLAPSLGEAKRMVEVCRGVTFMVHENFRWQRPMLELKRAAEEIGDLFFGRIQFRSAYDVYRDQPYLATDDRFILYDLGVHLFDLSRFFFGEAAALTCHTQRVNREIAGEDVATALLEMRSGAHVVVDMSYASMFEHETFPQTLVALEGSRGSARLERDYRLSVTTASGTRHSDVSPKIFEWTPAPVTAIPESVLNLQRHFIDCLEQDKTPATSGEDNLRTLELTFGAYDAAAQGSTLRLGGEL